MRKPDETTAYWAMSSDEALTHFRSTPQGLTAEEAQRRLSEYGPNLLKPRRHASALTVFLRQFMNSIVIILLVGTVIAAVTGDWSDALIILAIVLGSSVLSFVQEYSAGNAVERLNAQVEIKATVLRDGTPVQLPAANVVPGDVILLSAGSLIAADGILLEARDLYVSQAVLTGETFPVAKNVGAVAATASLASRTNTVYMGTSVRSGTGRALIASTGRCSELGTIAGRLTLRAPETSFERGVRSFGHLLTQVMLVLAIVIYAANVLLQKPMLDSLLFSVALAVGLTPQLLPAITTITLAQGAQLMARRGVIVKRLECIEDFGSMDTLCTDKTGTLTMGVVELSGAFDVLGNRSDTVARWALINASLETGLANPMDEAIRDAVHSDLSGVTKVDEVPYDFHRKRLSVVARDADGTWLVTKGALDEVLSVCTQVATPDGVADLDRAWRDRIEGQFAEWSGQGFRVLAVGIRLVEPKAQYDREDEHDLILAGLLRFFDPPKADVGAVIRDLAELGIELKIITGDNRLVAMHIAETIGLPVKGVLDGDEIDRTKDEALWQLADHTTLFAEVDPNEKERIILALKKMGHNVGYMGDGINDAPALHSADVSISVDGAVDVAKDAADLVLQRRDLGVLAEGIRQGRKTFANTLKYIFATTSANFGNMLSMAGASLFLPFLPMLPKQILLTNFLSDFPAMNIAADSVDAEWTTSPHRWNMRFIRDFMITFGAISSIFDYVTFGVLLLVLKVSTDQFRTAWFIESVLTELLVLLVVRTQRRFWKSRAAPGLRWAVLAIAVITIALPLSPLRPLLGFAVLPWPVILVLVLITLLYAAATELAKHWYYRRVQW